MKAKKSLVWFLAFFILIILNLGITMHYIKKVERSEQALQILDEIDKSYPSKEQYVSEGRYRYEPEVTVTDGRVANLKNFFRQYNSVLFDYSEHIVKISDKYSFDYRLLPAIAMQESTLCHAIPPGSHNCWGWGIYGDTVTKFNSYPEAIETVAKGLRENYINEGRVTASQIMQKYTPSSNGSWARAVNLVMKYLD